MAPLLRRRLICFYCGCRSTKKYSVGLQNWTCETCEAINHLDENGEITDPPPLDDTRNVRYAQAIERPVSPVFASPDEGLFCTTCIKNQHFFTQALASYLPPTTDPKYADYEREYPKYRKGLEERYPQVCDKCEPRVRERIRVTGYAAKTDHLRRMMDKTRGSQFIRYDWNWRHFIVYAGGIGWWSAVAGQVLWNAFGTLAVVDSGLRDENPPASVKDCVQQTFRDGLRDTNCTDLAQPLAVWAIVLGLLSIWWNPCLSTKLHGRVGRMVGLTEFYKLQGIINVCRLLIWYAMRDSKGSNLDASTTKAIHATMLAFNLAVVVLAYHTAYIDTTPKVIFQDGPEPLQARKVVPAATLSEVPPLTPSNRNRSSFRVQSPAVIQEFPINSLVTSSNWTSLSPDQPPTPPPENDVDEMDWTPIRAEFQPTRSLQVHGHTLKQAEPSPFHGCLPASPISQAQRLRNPPNQPTFRKASDLRQRNFFAGLRHSVPGLDFEENESPRGKVGECFDNSASPVASASPSRIEFSKPSFFARSDFGTDTGLESLFTGVFSLADDPLEVRNAREPSETQAARNQPPFTTTQKTLRVKAIGIVFLCLALCAWAYAERTTVGVRSLRLAALGTAAVVVGRELLQALSVDKAFWRLSDVLVLVVELAIAIFLGRAVKTSSIRETPSEEHFGNAPLWFLGALLIQGFVEFTKEMRNSSMADVLVDNRRPTNAASADHSGGRAQGSPEQSLALIQQSPDSPPTTHTGLVKSGVWQPSVTRTSAKRESFIPSSSLSSLSLGLGSETKSTGANAKFSTWGGQSDLMANRTRSKGAVPPWGKSTL